MDDHWADVTSDILHSQTKPLSQETDNFKFNLKYHSTLTTQSTKDRTWVHLQGKNMNKITRI